MAREGKSERKRGDADGRHQWQYHVKESWEDESLVEGNESLVEERNKEEEENQSLSTVDSRESGETLVVKDSTDTSDRAYMSTSSDSEESIRSEPVKPTNQMKQKKQTTLMKSFEATSTKETTKEEQPQRNLVNISNRRLTRAMKAGRI